MCHLLLPVFTNEIIECYKERSHAGQCDSLSQVRGTIGNRPNHLGYIVWILISALFLLSFLNGNSFDFLPLECRLLKSWPPRFLCYVG